MIQLTDRLINLGKKIPSKSKISSSIHLSSALRLILDCSKYKVDGTIIKSLHFFDLQSLVIALRIDTISKELALLRQKQLSEKGIENIAPATEEDFNNL